MALVELVDPGAQEVVAEAEGVAKAAAKETNESNDSEGSKAQE
jgi:hypothetical protein